MLDPDAAQIAQYACAQPTMRERGLPALRATMDDLPLPSGLPTMADTQDLVIPGPHGAIGLTVHRPADDDDAPVLVYFHGGGMCLGSNRSFEPLARNLAHASGATVIAVDYHLAPEDPPPAQFDDAWTATVWVAEHAGELRVDPARLAVVGDSAGGNLAAAVALAARDRGAGHQRAGAHLPRAGP